MKRVIFDVLLFISVFILPWWITSLCALLGMFLYKQFYESIIASAIIYAIYAIPGTGLTSSKLWFPVIISIVFISIQFARRYIILYKNEI